MQPLRLIFVLKQNNLFLIVKEDILPYDLTEHNFDTKKEITPGQNANHLMKADALIKAVKNDIKSKLTKREQWLYGCLFYGKEAVFISDIPMNNLSIRHFCDFTGQIGAKKCIVYYEPLINKQLLPHFFSAFLERHPESDAIGASNDKGCHYKIPDNSIELGEVRRVL